MTLALDHRAFDTLEFLARAKVPEVLHIFLRIVILQRTVMYTIGFNMGHPCSLALLVHLVMWTPGILIKCSWAELWDHATPSRPANEGHVL